MAASWVGLATSGYAVEGGFNRPGEPANQWGRWELAGLAPVHGEAHGFWGRAEAYLDAVAALGWNAVGLSVEWARVEPEEGRVDPAALDRYARILVACSERKLTPVVTLHHRTHPGWLGEELWLTPGAPDRFAAHVDRVVERLGASCRRWVTVHEPNAEAAAGWLVGAVPPGRLGAASDAWAVCDNLLTAHLLAYDVLRRHQPDAEVTLTPAASSVYDGHQLLVDLLCARYLGVGLEGLDEWLAERRADHRRAVRPSGPGEALLREAAAAASPFGPVRGPARRILRRASPRRAVDVLYAGDHALPLDAVAVSWRQPVPTRFVRFPVGPADGARKAPWVRQPWAVPPAPGGLAGWSRSQADLVPDLPRWVVDDGLPPPPGGVRRPDGWDIARYLDAQRVALQAAAGAGAPVAGYLVRSYGCGGSAPAAAALRSLADGR